VPDFQILDAVQSKRADEDAQYHHLLDNAMYDPRRKVNNFFFIIFKQLNLLKA
jgi:hypothetical protein